MATKEEKNSLARKLVEGENGHILVIPAHANGKTGVDTTKMYGKQDKLFKYHHAVKTSSVLTKGEKNRGVRRSDVIVSYTAKNCPDLFVVVDTVRSDVTISVKKMPEKVFQRKKDHILAQLYLFLEHATTLPKIV